MIPCTRDPDVSPSLSQSETCQGMIFISPINIACMENSWAAQNLKVSPKFINQMKLDKTLT